jgi:type IV pilus assembly protein PilQ
MQKTTISTIIKQVQRLSTAILQLTAVYMLAGQLFAQANKPQLLNLEYNQDETQPQITLTFSGTPPSYKYFAVEEPTRMIFDFKNIVNKLSNEQRNQSFSTKSLVLGIDVVDTANQVRLVVNSRDLFPVQAETKGNSLIFNLQTKESITNNTAVAHQLTSSPNNNNSINYTIKTVDFKRGDNGEGKLELDLANLDTVIDYRQENNNIFVDFKDATISEALQKRYDVTDFATPVQQFSLLQEDNKVVLKVNTNGETDRLAYQLDNKYIIEIRPLNQGNKTPAAHPTKASVAPSERISLNFQDIEVRAVLQLMADFANINLIASDSVNGHITLRLENVPWEQALDFILKSKGLGRRNNGNIVLIGPNEELNSRDNLEMEARNQSESLANMHSEFLAINYAKAADLVKIIKEDKNGLLSKRGAISVDERTNTILIKDTANRVEDIKSFIRRLDVAVKQVLIEAQIVAVSKKFYDAFGASFGTSFSQSIGNKGRFGITNGLENARTAATKGADALSATAFKPIYNATNTGIATGADAASRMSIAFARLPGGTLLDLELAATEAESKSKTLAKPKLLTLDKQIASIENGKDIPYAATTNNNGNNISFKRAVLKLEVKPQITPNEKILLELNVSKDGTDGDVAGQPIVSITNIKTNILVDNGETIVLGGIYSKDEKMEANKMKLLGDIPLLGNLFRGKKYSDECNETLIFVTPKIVKAV